MSFTIKCDKCGESRVFKSDSRPWASESIDVEISTSHSYGGATIESIDIDCANTKCLNGISIDY